MLTLYGHGTRTAANILKIRAALAEAGASYQYVTIDLAKGEQHEPKYKAINPHGKVPVLVDDDFALPESEAILWYVAEKFPQTKLLPTDAKGRARVRQWCDFASTSLYPSSYEIYLHTSYFEAANRSAFVAERAKANLERGLKVLEERLAGRSFVATEALTIADYSVAAVVHMLKNREQMNINNYPNIKAFQDRISKLPAWESAMSDKP
jgi:glutathione S-transferase